MRWGTICLAAGMLLALRVPSAAQYDDASSKPWSLTLGAFIPTSNYVAGVPSEDVGVTASLAYTLSHNDHETILGRFRYSQYKMKDDNSIQLASPMVEYRVNLSSPTYLALAVGAVLGHYETGTSSTSLAFEVGVGWNVNNNLLLEGRLIRGSTVGEHGVALSAGLRF